MAYYRISQGHDRDADVIKGINGVIEKHPRWGFWKTFKALRRKGYRWNQKRVYRVYCELRLKQKLRAKKRLSNRIKAPLLVSQLTNHLQDRVSI